MIRPNIAILGATGAVGQEFIKLIEERNFPFNQLKLLASSRSAGAEITVKGQSYKVEEATSNSFTDIDIASAKIFSCVGVLASASSPE